MLCKSLLLIIFSLFAAGSAAGGSDFDNVLAVGELWDIPSIDTSNDDGHVALNDKALVTETLVGTNPDLSLKPVLVVLNVGDQGTLDPATILTYPHRHSALIALRGGLEREIAQMDEASAELFLSEYGIAEPSLRRLIRLSYDLLGVQSFFTVGPDEVRAWTMARGGTAVDAAGTIHTDLARGFIRAEVIGYDDLVDAGSLAEAKNRGLLRLEGRDYVVKDGDVLEIRFNV